MSSFGDNLPIFDWEPQQSLRHCYLQDSSWYCADDVLEWIRAPPTPSAAPRSFVSDSMVLDEKNDRLAVTTPLPLQSEPNIQATFPGVFNPSLSVLWDNSSKNIPPPTRRPLTPQPNFPTFPDELPSQADEPQKRLKSSPKSWDDFTEDYDGDYTESDQEEAEMSFESSEDGNEPGSESPILTLGASKSPVMEALVYCALKGWGIHLIRCQGNDITFKVDDFETYCKRSQQICSKQHPTSDRQARIKALKRWFPDFPNRRDVPQPSEFYISIAKDKEKLTKIRRIIEKNRRLVGVKKIRRVA